MNPFNKVAAVMLSVMVVGCAVSADPRAVSYTHLTLPTICSV